MNFMEKLFSARWALTIIIGVVYAYCAIVGVIEDKDIVIITLLVIKEYFGRDDRKGERNKNENGKSDGSVGSA